jgi:hypothetical protein
MLLVVPVTDYELISAAAKPRSRDTGLSQPDRTCTLVGISLLKLYSNEVNGLGPGPLWRSSTVVVMHWEGTETKPSTTLKLSTPFSKPVLGLYSTCFGYTCLTNLILFLILCLS